MLHTPLQTLRRQRGERQTHMLEERYTERMEYTAASVHLIPAGLSTPAEAQQTASFISYSQNHVSTAVQPPTADTNSSSSLLSAHSPKLSTTSVIPRTHEDLKGSTGREKAAAPLSAY